jgi:hypothetical protein
MVEDNLTVRVMVEVFKTNVTEEDEARHVIGKLQFYFPDARINFDLEDCDKILRVENSQIDIQKTVELVSITGYRCEVLE